MAAQISKRMAVLVRRETDTREFFSNHWQNVHGSLVAKLPGLKGYIQNHIVEEFGQSPFRADGFVEQEWETTEAMQHAYESAIAKTLLLDEPSYLGHATNYATLADAPLKPEPDGRKIILLISGDVDAQRSVVTKAGFAEGCIGLIRDSVTETIPKAGMQTGPQLVDVFLHVYFNSPEQARKTGAGSVRWHKNLPPETRLGAWRVRTVQIV